MKCISLEEQLKVQHSYTFIPSRNALKLTAFASNISFEVKATLSRVETDKSFAYLPRRSNHSFSDRGPSRRPTYYKRTHLFPYQLYFVS